MRHRKGSEIQRSGREMEIGRGGGANLSPGRLGPSVEIDRSDHWVCTYYNRGLGEPDAGADDPRGRDKKKAGRPNKFGEIYAECQLRSDLAVFLVARLDGFRSIKKRMSKPPLGVKAPGS
jgi:hypothetical protein